MTVQVFRITRSAVCAIVRCGETAFGQLRFEGGAIGLGGAASEILDEEAGHSSSVDGMSAKISLNGMEIAPSDVSTLSWQTRLPSRVSIVGR